VKEKEMSALKVGDEVRVFDVNGRRMGQPEGGWSGKIVKVGRTLVTIEYSHKTKTFRMDRRTVNDNYGHQYFKTLGEVADDQRLKRATAAIEERGVELVRGHRLTLDQIERLADFVRRL
jgi:preprotein translocase subunit YajC